MLNPPEKQKGDAVQYSTPIITETKYKQTCKGMQDQAAQ
jgi:hypothetical protein